MYLRTTRIASSRHRDHRDPAQDSHGYDYKYARYLEHYLGGRHWQDEWEKSDAQDADSDFYDARSSVLRWWQRISRAALRN